MSHRGHGSTHHPEEPLVNLYNLGGTDTPPPHPSGTHTSFGTNVPNTQTVQIFHELVTKLKGDLEKKLSIMRMTSTVQSKITDQPDTRLIGIIQISADVRLPYIDSVNSVVQVTVDADGSIDLSHGWGITEQFTSIDEVDFVSRFVHSLREILEGKKGNLKGYN